MDSNVLREFLVKLGYKVDEASQRRFAEGVERMTDRVKDLAKAAVVMGTAVGVAVVKVASDLGNLYFASKRIGASAGNIRAFEFAIKQMGGSGEAARAALEGLARFMRDSPGAEGFLTGLGIETRDANGNLRDTVQIYTELAGVLKSMDSSQANAVAQVLGLDDNTLQAIRSGDLKAYMADYLATLDKLGIKQDEAAENSARFTRRLQELKTVFGLLVEKYAAGIIGADHGKIWSGEIEAVKTFVRWLREASEWIDKVTSGRWGDWLGRNTAKLLASLGNKEALAALEANGDIAGAVPAKPNGPIASGAAALFSNLEKQYGLPAGLLDRMWNQESGRGKNMLSPKGAMGHFQFMPGTAKQYGVADPNDLNQSATGAARYMRDLLKTFNGDINQAVAAYNWGPANLQRYGLGAAPSETRHYLKNVSPMSLQSSTTIHVNGSSDPLATAQAVANLQVQTSQDMARNLQGAMR